MNIILSIFLTILPIYLICLFAYKKDNKKEPKKLLIKLFIFGMLSSIPAFIIELIIENIFGNINKLSSLNLLFYILIGIAFIEETCKWLFIYLTVYFNKEFDQTYDAIIYCIFTSLGFACIENILYCYTVNNIITSFLRGLTAIPGHAFYAIIMGYFLFNAKKALIIKNQKKEKLMIILSILLPTLVHTIYDYFIFNEKMIYGFLFVILLFFIYIFSIEIIRKSSKNNADFYKD